MTLLFANVAEKVQQFDTLYRELSIEHFMMFFEITARFLPHIVLQGHRGSHQPASLPDTILQCLVRNLGLSIELARDLWSACGEDLVNAHHEKVLRSRRENMVNADHAKGLRSCLSGLDANLALQDDLGVEIMAPPTETCLDRSCSDHGKRLGGKKYHFAGHLFTRDRGVLPIRIMRVYCRACNTSYHPNYFVSHGRSQDAVRQYYTVSVPEYVEVNKTVYVQSSLIELLRVQMAFAHASGDACARIYNLAYSRDTFTSPHLMNPEHVWNVFYLHALLLDAQENGMTLRLPNSGDHCDRFNDAMDARNHRYAGIGQPMWAHACDECEKIIPPPAGSEAQGYTRLNACVMDGVTLGHPRCNFQHCTNRLNSPRDRFCETHKTLEQFCAVRGCNEPVSDRMRTCGLPSHRQLEVTKRQQGQAYFRLRARLPPSHQSNHVPMEQPEDPIDIEVPGEGDEQETTPEDSPDRPTDENVDSRSNDTTRRPKLRTSLTRRWTHNEQLIVCCCGIVIARCTFFEAESMSNVVSMLRATFPPSLPRAAKSFCFFDNNCMLLRHMLANDILEFQNTCFAVDVFHASVKHKDTDLFCARNCNPAGFPELHNGPGQWVFNTSVAEQTNAWFGGFLPIVREMTEIRFNFFLDEMLKIRNEYQAGVLRARGARPRLVPMEELRLPHRSTQ